MRETHGHRNLARIGRNPCCSFAFRKQEHEAGEILGIVLDALDKNHAVIMFGGAPSSDGGAGFVRARKRFAHAAGGVFGGNTLPLRMSGEKTLALRQSHGMRSDRLNIRERRAGNRDELHFNRQNCLRDNRKPAFLQEIEHAHDRACQGILHRRKEGVSGTFGDSREGRLKCCPRHGRDRIPEKLDSGGFAECAGLALKSYAHNLAIGCAHRQALSCNKERKTKSKVSTRTGKAARSGRPHRARKLRQAYNPVSRGEHLL